MAHVVLDEPEAVTVGVTVIPTPYNEFMKTIRKGTEAEGQYDTYDGGTQRLFR